LRALAFGWRDPGWIPIRRAGGNIPKSRRERCKFNAYLVESRVSQREAADTALNFLLRSWVDQTQRLSNFNRRGQNQNCAVSTYLQSLTLLKDWLFVFSVGVNAHRHFKTHALAAPKTRHGAAGSDTAHVGSFNHSH
jgi:hypothetical protein